MKYSFQHEKLKPLRVKKKLSMEALGKLAGVSFSIISKVEKGERKNINTETLGKLAAALAVSPNYFMKN